MLRSAQAGTRGQNEEAEARAQPLGKEVPVVKSSEKPVMMVLCLPSQFKECACDFINQDRQW